MNRHPLSSIHLLIAAVVLLAPQPLQMVYSCSCHGGHHAAAAEVIASTCCHAHENPSGDCGGSCSFECWCGHFSAAPYGLTKLCLDSGTDNEILKSACDERIPILIKSASMACLRSREQLCSFAPRHCCASLCRFLL